MIDLDLPKLLTSVKGAFPELKVSMGNEYYATLKSFISTGSIILDSNLGGGLPLGRITEIAGEPDSGKTSLVISSMIETQKLGGICVLLENESKFQMERAERMGLVSDELVVIPSPTVEDGFDAIAMFVQSVREQSLVVKIMAYWDSIAASPTRGSLESRFAGGIADKARMTIEGLRVLNHALSKYANDRMGIVLVNHVMANIGSMGVSSTGGRGIRFYASLRLRLYPAGKLYDNDGETVIGTYSRVQSRKCHITQPFLGNLVLPLTYYSGYHHDNELWTLCNELGYLIRSGSWYTLKVGDRTSEGSFYSKNFSEVLDNEDLRVTVEEHVFNAIMHKNKRLTNGEGDITEMAKELEEEK